MDLSPATGAAVPFVGTQSLGLCWNTEMDTLQVKAAVKDNPFTRRGLLSHIMTPYDPFGIGAPAMRQAKELQRKVTPRGEKKPNWDKPLPEEVKTEWNQLLQTMEDMQKIAIQRSLSSADTVRKS